MEKGTLTTCREKKRGKGYDLYLLADQEARNEGYAANPFPPIWLAVGLVHQDGVMKRLV